MTQGFDIVVLGIGAEAVLEVRGELDMNTAPRLRHQLIGLVDDGVRDITVDLTELDFMDSSGLYALIAGLKRVRERGGYLALCSPKPPILKVLEITGLTGVFGITEPKEGRRVSLSEGRGITTTDG